MRTAILAVMAAFLLGACGTPSPEVRSVSWENNAYLLTQPATDY